jgi:hypothetical protein
VKASTEIKPLEAVIPWSVAAGNHDTAAVCAGGSACPGADTRATVRDVSTFNRYFPPSRFPDLRGTYEPNRSENSWSAFSAGGKDWLVLTLELWARPEVVAWANDVVAANPTRNVIINTHSYLAADGSISTSNGGYGSTSPQYVFDHLVKLHPNIKMVVSGHVGQAAMRTDTGVAGNKVISFLQAFHSTTNPVRLIVEVPEADAVRIPKNAEVSVRVPALKNAKYPASVTRTTPCGTGEPSADQSLISPFQSCCSWPMVTSRTSRRRWARSSAAELAAWRLRPRAPIAPSAAVARSNRPRCSSRNGDSG